MSMQEVYIVLRDNPTQWRFDLTVLLLEALLKRKVGSGIRRR